MTFLPLSVGICYQFLVSQAWKKSTNGLIIKSQIHQNDYNPN
jgi:hypothetical protein